MNILDSDHHPIYIDLNNPSSSTNYREEQPTWNLNKADWDFFAQTMDDYITEVKSSNNDQPGSQMFCNFIAQLHMSANLAIPFKKGQYRHSKVPYGVMRNMLLTLKQLKMPFTNSRNQNL